MTTVAHALDLSTRYFWRALGRPIDIAGKQDWLASPYNAEGEIGEDWLTALEHAGRVRTPSTDDGLLASMEALDGPRFSAAALNQRVRDFYETTASWRMDVWSEWNPLFAPAGELIARVWMRRVGQLSLPVRPLSVSRGMSSVVRIVEDGHGERTGAAWLRTLRSDSSTVYSGLYRVGRLPGDAQPHVHVSFPLESGSIQVHLAPRNDPDGSFWLESRSHRFGSDGAYAVVRVGGTWFASLTPIRETFHVFVDEEGVLRTDHRLGLGRWQALRLHYRLERSVTRPSDTP